MGFVLALENVFASCVSIDDLAVAGWRLLSDISLFFPAPTVCHFFLKKDNYSFYIFYRTACT
jgi:hypothetical protein